MNASQLAKQDLPSKPRPITPENDTMKGIRFKRKRDFESATQPALKQKLYDSSKLTVQEGQALWNALPYKHSFRRIEQGDLQYPVLNPHPCSKCQDMTIGTLQSQIGYSHHESREALLLAAGAGCRICLWICRFVFESWPDGKPVVRNSGTMAPKMAKGLDFYGTLLEGSTPEASDAQNQVNPYPLILKCIDIAGMSRMTITSIPSSQMMDEWRVHYKMSLYSDEECHTSKLIPSRRLMMGTTLDRVRQRYLPLLNLEYSGTYPHREEPCLPTRIIDVGDSEEDMVYLKEYDSHLRRAHYICLSHRWSQSKPLTATCQTLSKRRKGILMKELSPTLRDAILITRAFQIKYIWIDSLCILQDSQVDWELESAKMGNYYNKSWLTIGAGAESDNWGILGRRTVNGGSLTYYRLPVDLEPSGHAKKPELYFNDQDESKWNNRGGSLLVGRGWTLQEEALSPCYLAFQNRQTSLRVRNQVHHESGFVESIVKEGYLNLSDSTFSKLTSWGQLVEDYSRRELTIETDKLPAISGLAQKYQQNRNNSDDVYLAGLWRSSLQTDLCWSVERSAITQSKLPVRPSTYRAPSWSWASLDAPVTFLARDLKEAIDLEVLNVSTKGVGSDPFGHVCNGSLTLRAKIGQQLWKRRANHDAAWYHAHPLHPKVLTEIIIANIPYSNATLVWDIPKASIATEVIVWSVTIRNDFAIALQEHPEVEGAFIRVGCIIARSPSLDDAFAEVGNVTIL